MKKDNVCTILFSLVICIFLACILMISETYGITLEQDYRADSGPFTGEKYFNDMVSKSSIFCNGHGTPFFIRRDTDISITGEIYRTDIEGYPLPRDKVSIYETGVQNIINPYRDYYLFKDKPHWSCGEITSYNLKIQVTSYSGFGTTNTSGVRGKIRNDSRVVNGGRIYVGWNGYSDQLNGLWIYAAEKTNYTIDTPPTKEINTKISYLLSEANSNTPGLFPAQSQANIAWWNKSREFKVDINEAASQFDWYEKNLDQLLREDYINEAQKEAVEKMKVLQEELRQKEVELNNEKAIFSVISENAKAQISKIEEEIANLEENLKENEKEREKYREYRDEDKKKIAELKNELRPLQTEFNNVQKRLNVLIKERQGLEGQLARLNSDSSRLEGNVTTLDEEIRELQARISTLNYELNVLQNNGASLQEISAKNEEIKNAEKQLSRKQNEFNSKNNLSNNKKSQIEDKEKAIEEKQEQIDAQIEILNEKQIAVNEKQAEIDTYNDWLQNDLRMLEQLERNIADCKARIENAEGRKESYEYILGENSSGTSWSDGDNVNKATMTASQYQAYLEERLEEIRKELDQLARTILNIQNNINTDVSQIEEILNGFHTNNYADKEGYSASKSDEKIREAEIFEKMHDQLRAIGADVGPGSKVDYQKTVKDLTDVDNIEVEYDAETQKYTIGPFKIEYLEVYANNNQFAGIKGDPVLYMQKDNEVVKRKLSEGGWDFAYKKRNADGELVDIARKTTGTLGDSVPEFDGTKVFTNFNAVPHTDEEFYIVVDYEEGLNKVTGLEFEFRCLTIDAEYETSKGVIGVYKYGVSMFWYEECGDWYWNNWIDDWDICDAPKAGWIRLKREYIKNVDIQPTMRVIMARRGYVELELWEGLKGNIKPGDDPASLLITWDIDLTTTIGGDVWIDDDDQKDKSAIDGIKESNLEKEKGVNNIAVTVYLYQNSSKICQAIAHNEDGSRIEWPVYTGAEGLEQGHWEVPRLEAPGGGAKRFYVVEFEYDGQFLQSTVYMADSNGREGTADDFKKNPNNYSNSSLAVEEVENRYIFDQTFGEITGNSSINGTETMGITNLTNEEGQPKNPYKDMEGGHTRPDIVTSIDTTDPMFNQISYKSDETERDEEDGDVAKVRSILKAPYTDEENEDGNHPAKVTNVDEYVTKEEYRRYRMVATTFYNDTSDYGVGVNKDDFRLHLPVKEWKYVMNKKKDKNKGKRYIDDYMLHINLGLKERKETDISVLKDLYKVTVVVNERKITKEFNPHGDESDYKDLLIQLEQTKVDGGYALGLYSSDVAYQSYKRYCNAISKVQDIKEGTELRVFATYIIRVYNNSDTNDVEINELTDYCDGEFSLVQEDFQTSIINDDMKRENTRVAEAPYYRICEVDTANEWKASREENLEDYIEGETAGDLYWWKASDEDGFHSWKTSQLTDTKLTPTQYAEIFSTYEVNQSGYYKMKDDHNASISDRDNLLKEHCNIAEVSSYSTYYTEADLEPEDNYHPYEAGWISGRVDKDSAPNNIDRNDLANEDKYEDDTYQAPMLKIELRVTEREMWGTVWEDKKDVPLDYDIMAGDGIFNGEDMIDGVEVSLYEVINLSEVNAGGYYDGTIDGMEYYYKVPNQFYNFPSGSQSGEDGSGTVVTGNNPGGGEGNWYIYGFLAGDYTIRFDYGKASNGNATIYKSDGSSVTEAVIKYNGQDYENTKFMGDNLNEDITVNEKTSKVTINDKFLDITGQGISTEDTSSKARDNEARRMVVDAYSRNIENERGEILRDRLANNTEYVESTQMFSETPIMQVEVEDPKIIQRNETPDGTPSNPLYVEDKQHSIVELNTYTYTIPNINFGIEERAKTDIKLEKFIDSIYLIKSGEIIFQAKVNEDGSVDTQNENSKHLNKLTSMGHEEACRGGVCQQGFFAIAVEDVYMDDLSLMISYKIQVSNISEVDFTGALSRHYKAESIIEMATTTPTIDLYESGGGDLEHIYEDGISTNTTLHHLLEIQYGEADGYIDTEVSDLINNSDAFSIDPTDSLRPEVIVYGKFVGRYYYENRIGEDGEVYNVTNYNLKTSDAPDLDDIMITYPADSVVKTTVDKLIEYIDINTSLDLEENTDIEDSSWTLVDSTATGDGSIVELKAMISDSAYKDHGRNEGSGRGIYDEKGRNFFRTENVNIATSDNEALVTNPETGRVEYAEDKSPISLYNPSLTVELVPEEYSTSGSDGKSNAMIYIVTRKNSTSDLDVNEMKMDNLAEVLVYSNTTGRRDYNSVPGNAMAIAKKENAGEGGFWLAGYNSIDTYGMRDTYSKVTASGELEGTNEIYNWTKYPENDQFAPEYVSVIPPTGTPFMTIVRRNVVQMVGLSTILIGLIGVFIVEYKRHFNKK